MERSLVLAARLEHGENHQVGVRKKPLFGFGAGGLGYAGQRTQVLIAGEASKVIEANPSERGYFVLGKDLLARPHCNHGRLSLNLMLGTDYSLHWLPAIVVPYHFVKTM